MILRHLKSSKLKSLPLGILSFPSLGAEFHFIFIHFQDRTETSAQLKCRKLQYLSQCPHTHLNASLHSHRRHIVCRRRALHPLCIYTRICWNEKELVSLLGCADALVLIIQPGIFARLLKQSQQHINCKEHIQGLMSFRHNLNSTKSSRQNLVRKKIDCF